MKRSKITAVLLICLALFVFVREAMATHMLMASPKTETQKETETKEEEQRNKELNRIMEERLRDLCKHYEDRFDYHSRNYNMFLTLGSSHLKFAAYHTANPYLAEIVQEKLIGGNWSLYFYTYGLSIPPYDFLPSEELDFLNIKKVRVSGSPSTAGGVRETATGVWNFLSSMSDIDQGAWLIITTYGGAFDRDYNFEISCTECANLLARFINEARSIWKNTYNADWYDIN